MATDFDERRLAVNPVYVPLKLSENAFELRVGPFVEAKHSIQDADGEGVVGELVDYLDGSHTVSEILDQFDDDHVGEIRAVLKKLHDGRALVDVSERDPDELWSYSVIDEDISESELDRLYDASVGIVTRGRIGTMVAEDLSETGADEVRVKTIGDGNDHARSRDPEVVHTSEDIETLVEAVDYVLYADGSPGFEFAKRVNEAAVRTGTPVTYGQLMGVEGILGPTVVPGESPCLECLLDRWRGHQSDVKSYRELLASSRDTHDVHLSMHSRLLAGLLSKEALTQLLTGHGYVVGRTVDVDLLGMEFESNELMKMPRCSVCGVEHEDEQRMINETLLEYTHD